MYIQNRWCTHETTYVHDVIIRLIIINNRLCQHFGSAHEYLSEETILIAYCTNEHLMCEASILGIMLELGRGKLQRTVTSSPHGQDLL